MLSGVIIRGTNPEHEFELPYADELIDSVRVIYGQNNRQLFKKTWKVNESNNTCQIGQGKIVVLLSQEETYLASPSRPLDIEIRIKLKNGKVVGSDEPISLRVIDTMDNEVMN